MVDAQSFHSWHVRTRTYGFGVGGLASGVGATPEKRVLFILRSLVSRILSLNLRFQQLEWELWICRKIAKKCFWLLGFFASDRLVTRSSSSLIRNPIWVVAKSSLIFFHRNHQCPSTYLWHISHHVYVCKKNILFEKWEWVSNQKVKSLLKHCQRHYGPRRWLL